jgi:hypothetical protein
MSASTAALFRELDATGQYIENLTASYRQTGPASRVTANVSQKFESSVLIDSFASRLDAVYSRALALGAKHLRDLPENVELPEYGPGNAVGIAEFHRRQTAAALAKAEAEKAVVEPLMPGAGPEGRYTLAGDLRAMVNRMAGRGGDELLYVETQRQTELLGEQNQTLREIKAAMDKPVTVPVTAPGVFVP